MNNFTEEEIRVAKQVKDALVNGDLAEELRSVYIAGEIVMWDELRNQSLSKDSSVLVKALEAIKASYKYRHLQGIIDHALTEYKSQSPSLPNESGLREILEEALKDHENDRKWLLEKYPQVKDKIDTAVRPWIEKARKALSQYSSPSQPEAKGQEGIDDMGADPL